MIYLDNAATRKPTKSTIDMITRLMTEEYGNPSSSHAMGRKAQLHLEDARDRCADALRCDRQSIFFTSGASESNAQIIKTAALYGARNEKKHIVSTSIEHSSMLMHLEALEKTGFEVSYARPNKNGNVEADAVTSLIRDDTFFVSVMLVNNETGAIQDIEAIARYCHEHGIMFHTDATQGVGMYQMQHLDHSCIDFLSLSGHKLGAGMGAGLLYMSSYAKKTSGMSAPQPIVYGHQEQGSRGGTYNLPAIVALSVELERECKCYSSNEYKIAELEKQFVIALSSIPFRIHCKQDRKPGILSIHFPNIPANSLMEYLSSRGIYISAGSACTSGIPEPSHVLQEMGLDRKTAMETVRISINLDNVSTDLLKVASEIVSFSTLWRFLSNSFDK